MGDSSKNPPPYPPMGYAQHQHPAYPQQSGRVVHRIFDTFWNRKVAYDTWMGTRCNLQSQFFLAKSKEL